MGDRFDDKIIIKKNNMKKKDIKNDAKKESKNKYKKNIYIYI